MMGKLQVALLGLCATLASAAAFAAPPVARPAVSPVLPLTAQVDGKGYAEWSAAWWQWAMSMPVEPYVVPDGRFCDLGQEGPVWFLAGTDGSFDAQRECRVPAGKHLFLPVINMLQQTRLGTKKDAKASSCKQLQASVAVNNDHLASAVVLIDGVVVKNVASYRVHSNGCFPMYPNLPEDDRFLTPIAASDGYWLMIEPLPIGRHTITVGANYGAPKGGHHQMVQNFEYVLLVGMQEGFVMR